MTVEMRTNHFGGLPSGRSSSAGKSLRSSGGAAWERRKHRDPPTTDSDDNSDSPGNTTTKGKQVYLSTHLYSRFHGILMHM